MAYTTQKRTARTGFSLVEMLFAIGIILVLVALTVAAVYRFRDTGPASATSTNIGKLKGPFDAQWRAVRDEAMRERIPDNFTTGSLSDPKTRQDYVKARLTQVFPTTFREALTAQPGLKVISAYNTYLTGLGINANTTAPPAIQQSVCLLMALQFGPSNGGLNPDNLTSTVAVRTDVTSTIKAFALVDGWNRPLLFTRDLNGKGPAIYSLGQDNTFGTDDDISSLNP